MLLFLFSILLGLFNGPVNVCFLSPQGIRQSAQGIREAAFPEGKLHALPCRFQPSCCAQQDDARCDAGEDQHGYEDARTKERGQMPERYEEESGTGKRFFRKGNQAVLILAVILLVFISPFVKGAVGGILTFAVGILLLPFWLIVGLGIGAVVLLVGGIAAVVAGAGLLAVMTGTGILTIGIGCLMIALAILMILGLISIAVRIVPKWFRKITDFFNRVLYRKRKEEVK